MRLSVPSNTFSSSLVLTPCNAPKFTGGGQSPPVAFQGPHSAYRYTEFVELLKKHEGLKVNFKMEKEEKRKWQHRYDDLKSQVDEAKGSVQESSRREAELKHQLAVAKAEVQRLKVRAEQAEEMVEVEKEVGESLKRKAELLLKHKQQWSNWTSSEKDEEGESGMESYDDMKGKIQGLQKDLEGAKKCLQEKDSIIEDLRKSSAAAAATTTSATTAAAGGGAAAASKVLHNHHHHHQQQPPHGDDDDVVVRLKNQVVAEGSKVQRMRDEMMTLKKQLGDAEEEAQQHRDHVAKLKAEVIAARKSLQVMRNEVEAKTKEVLIDGGEMGHKGSVGLLQGDRAQGDEDGSGDMTTLQEQVRSQEIILLEMRDQVEVLKKQLSESEEAHEITKEELRDHMESFGPATVAYTKANEELQRCKKIVIGAIQANKLQGVNTREIWVQYWEFRECLKAEKKSDKEINAAIKVLGRRLRKEDWDPFIRSHGQRQVNHEDKALMVSSISLHVPCW